MGLNCALVWLLAWRLGGGWAASLAASLLFAVHPIHVETVSGVGGARGADDGGGVPGGAGGGGGEPGGDGAGAKRCGVVLGCDGVGCGGGVGVFEGAWGWLIVPALGLLMWAPTFAEVTAGKPERARLRERVVRLLPAGAGAALAVGAYLLTRRLVLGHWIFGDVVVPGGGAGQSAGGAGGGSSASWGRWRCCRGWRCCCWRRCVRCRTTRKT